MPCVSVFVFGCANARADAPLRTQTRVEPGGKKITRGVAGRISTCILEESWPLPLYGGNKITAAQKMILYRRVMFQSQQVSGKCQGPVGGEMKI